MADLTALIERLEKADGPDRRILERLDTSGSCWLWLGPLDERGRGRVSRGGRSMIHHRAVWEILVGPIPSGALLCHHCDNPQCANPSHIYVGDSKTNVDDMFSRGRHWTQTDPDRAKLVAQKNGSKNNWCRGANNPRSKLTPSDVEQIRQSRAVTKELAAAYSVDRTTIQRIRRGALWDGTNA